MTDRVRVIVADDQAVVRDGLVALLGLIDDIDVVGAARDGQEVLDLLGAGTGCDVVLMDLRMPVLDGVAATARVARDHPSAAVLVLTTYADDDSVAAALAAGARGYLTKNAGRAEIAAAVRSAAAGQSTFDPAVAGTLVTALVGGAPTPVVPERDGLTAREREVLTLIAKGLSNAEIAAALFVGQTTVKTHINNAFAKIGASNRADAVRYAYRTGLTEP